MPMEEDLFLNGVGRTQTIYQQPSTGEKHVLFYPTSPAPSATSQSSSSFANASSGHVRSSNNNTDTFRVKRGEGGTSMEMTADTPEQRQQRPQEKQQILPPVDQRHSFRIGIYGWRKRCLYVLILGLLIMVIINLALTLWVLKVMEFSSEGMGQLKIVTGGVKLEGKAFIMDSLIASSIKSKAGHPIVVESSRNLTLSTRNIEGHLDNFIYLDNDKFECLANSFKVTDDRGSVLFSANTKEAVVGADTLKVTGEGGTVFSGSIQTPTVRAEAGHGLRLESTTRTLEIRGPSGINIDSRAGDISSISLNDIKLKSAVGGIKLESASIMMPLLPTAIPANKAARTHEIFQLCACKNGRLFLSPPHTVCSADEDEKICR